MRPPRMPLAIIVAGMMSGCGGTTNEVITSPQIGQYRIVRIAVLPFTVTPKTLGQGRGYAEPAPPPVAAEKLAELFYLKLNAREGIVVVPPRNVRGAMPALPAAVSRAQLRELWGPFWKGPWRSTRNERAARSAWIGLKTPRKSDSPSGSSA